MIKGTEKKEYSIPLNLSAMGSHVDSWIWGEMIKEEFRKIDLCVPIGENKLETKQMQESLLKPSMINQK